MNDSVMHQKDGENIWKKREFTLYSIHNKDSENRLLIQSFFFLDKAYKHILVSDEMS